jgi:xanthine dehydrogenase accessory factor
MRDVIDAIDAWRAAGDDVALATVVETWGSAPRGVGAKMAVSASGKIAGSVSGGCVEGAVVEAAREVLASRKPRLLHFGVSDADAWSVGLSCGGRIEVFVAPLASAVYEPLREALAAERPVAAATVVGGPGLLLGRSLLVDAGGARSGSLEDALDADAATAAREALASARSRRVSLGEVQLLVEAFPGPPTLVMVGGVHIAVGLAALAKTMGYRTVVVDPRKTFGSPERFPHVDRLLNDWPDEALRQLGLDAASAVAVLTHDPKLDDPALRLALASPAFYVGALGSRATQERRRKRLLEAGLAEERLDRLHAPIGLDLGGRSPEEIALAVMAQVVAARNGRSGK